MAEQEARIPSEEEIAQLPRWARVAFAARCARRVQPVFKAAWPNAPVKGIEAVERAISVAEGSGIAAGDVATYGRTAAAAYAAADVALTAGLAAAARAARTAAYAARAAARAVVRADAGTDAATRAAVHATTAFSVADALNADFANLRSAAKKEQWTDTMYVPPEFFGPLWPEGEPEGWPSVQASEKVFDRGPMSLFFDRAEFSDEQIAEVISLLSELYGAVSGDRLVIKGTTLLVPEREPVSEGV